ncbi:MAG: tRNA (adenosine(37)-N6)-threonylcarbamoyltransferase complex dimerization subunit type 1 TsaB [Alphaproteobacteria bacterium]
MLILSIDTSAAGCGVALVRDGKVVAERQEIMPRGQDARLIPLIEDVLREAGADFSALERIAVTRGPGSFTGIRIGLAAARGLGLALGIPVVGVDRFSLYRDAIAPDGDLLVVVDSKRRELFCRFFPQAGEAGEPFLATPEQLASYDRQAVAVTGDGAAGLGLARRLTLQQSEAVHAALTAAEADPGDPAWRALPLYLRPPDVSCGPVPPAEEAAMP